MLGESVLKLPIPRENNEIVHNFLESKVKINQVQQKT